MSNNIEYIHLPSMGDLAACNAVLKTLPQALEEQFGHGRIEGYLFHLIYNQESIIEKLISRDLSFVKQHEFPFVFISLQPKDDYFELAKDLYQLTCIRLQ